jgi:hypothetical protein
VKEFGNFLINFQEEGCFIKPITYIPLEAVINRWYLKTHKKVPLDLATCMSVQSDGGEISGGFFMGLKARSTLGLRRDVSATNKQHQTINLSNVWFSLLRV